MDDTDAQPATATPEQLIRDFPAIKWRSPITINGNPFACRICIATKGFTFEDIKELPKTEADFAKHMAFTHNLIAVFK